MSRFYSVEIADAVSLNANIEIRKSVFGLFSSAYYIPTQSKVESFAFFYDRLVREDLETLLKADDDKVADVVRHLTLAAVPNGNLKVELCVSRDRRFAALRLYRFHNLLYCPLSEIRCFEGDVAVAVASLFFSK